MANISGVNTTYGSYTKPPSEEIIREPKNTWDQDMFLKVLVAQMSNQDPMNPQSDTEFIGQMAQFSSLEQMTKLTGAMTQMQAYNLVGKYVSAVTNVQVDASGNTVEAYVKGKVDSTYTKNGITYVVVNNPAYDENGDPVYVDGKLKINTFEIPLADIEEVIDPGLYDDSVLNDDKILAKLDELINLLKEQRENEDGEDGENGEDDTNGEGAANAGENV